MSSSALRETTARQRRRIAIFDLDRTITRNGTFTPFLLSAQPSLAARVRLLARLLAHMACYKLGAIDRTMLKNEMMAAAFAERDCLSVRAAAERFVEKVLQSGLNKNALDAISRHKKNGDKLILATASVDIYAKGIGQALGFDAVVSTQTDIDECESRAPRVRGENCYGPTKRDYVMRALETSMQADRRDLFLIFYTDHHSDVPLVGDVDEVFVVRPGKKMRSIARAKNWTILDW